MVRTQPNRSEIKGEVTMNTVDMINTIVTEGRALEKKAETLNPQSGVISGMVRTQEGGMELYEQVQRGELGVHLTRKGWEETYTAYLASKAGVEQLQRAIVTVAKAGGAVCAALGGDDIGDILTTDANDQASIAARAGADLKNAPFVGPGFEQALSHLRDQLLAREAAHQEIVISLAAAKRDFAQAFYKAASVVAQAKAFLAANGVKVLDRKVTKRKKAEPKKDEAPAPAPTPALVPIAA